MPIKKSRRPFFSHNASLLALDLKARALALHSIPTLRSIIPCVLHDELEHLLDLIPVAGIELRGLDLEVAADIHELGPRGAVVHEGEGGAGAAEAARASDAVEVGFVVGIAALVGGDVVVDYHGDLERY